MRELTRIDALLHEAARQADALFDDAFLQLDAGLCRAFPDMPVEEHCLALGCLCDFYLRLKHEMLARLEATVLQGRRPA